MLQNKNVIVGICGSIAAYKSLTLVRLLVKAGANVKVILTPDALNFVTPLSLATLSKNEVYTAYFEPETGVWSNHVDLALWADYMLVAPITANTLAKFANGLCDNLLTAVYLSAVCPIYLAPAMDLDMWAHTQTQKNLAALPAQSVTVIKPNSGELASGLVGEGRMAEPEEIADFLTQHIASKLPLYAKKVLVTAGPTYEDIDPVRFIGNHSTGKMGFAIAAELQKLGATVTLIAGPVALTTPNGVNRVDVRSARDMFEACDLYFSEQDICIMCAAVADYTPLQKAPLKIKKDEPSFSITLEKTVDILSELGKRKTDRQLLIGFALETNNEEENAKAKLERKNLDYIVLNSTNTENAAFGSDFNKVVIFNKSLQKQSFASKPKTEVAKDICTLVVNHFK